MQRYSALSPLLSCLEVTEKIGNGDRGLPRGSEEDEVGPELSEYAGELSCGWGQGQGLLALIGV